MNNLKEFLCKSKEIIYGILAKEVQSIVVYENEPKKQTMVFSLW